MSTDFNPGVYAQHAPTDVFFVGQHNLFTRNGVTINDLSLMDTYVVDELTGFDRPDGTIANDPKASTDGESYVDSNWGGRTMTLSGHVRAGSYSQAMILGEALQRSIATRREMPMSITVQPGSFLQQKEMRINCAPADFTIDPKAVQSDLTGVYTRPFTLALRASYPFYQSPIVQTFGLVPTTVSIPGRPYDRVYDLSYNELMDSSGSLVTTGPNLIDITHDGTWDAPLIITMHGKMTRVSLVNQTTQQIMYFTDIPAGATAVVNTLTGQAFDGFGVSRPSLIQSRSDYMMLGGKRDGHTGVNRIVLYVEDYDSGASFSASFQKTNF